MFLGHEGVLIKPVNEKYFLKMSFYTNTGYNFIHTIWPRVSLQIGGILAVRLSNDTSQS